MIRKKEISIEDVQELHMMFQKQLDAKDEIIDARTQQISILKEAMAFLESQNKKWAKDMKLLAMENEKLKEICAKQQVLLDEFSKLME